ncbi:hypothetical protein ABMV07_07715 [Corynebacterium belfantii]|uniref:hypothetical protein n=1 Tax=Corynebacterium belfantii TaxID=2014537 RepID=UPI00095A72E9|nr:hypothetical protein [Corynebacterium belfantii]MBG9311073.1 hypothetical protein [Corynebacterium belfantii]OLN14518.1 hypothetical protein BUE64_12680 [Corynebacterium diphtheriae subsp. lausannense]
MAITAVAIPFNPGIPWVTWAGAFLLLFFAAELVSMFIKTGVEGEGKKTQAVLCFSAAAALILILLLVIFFD